MLLSATHRLYHLIPPAGLSQRCELVKHVSGETRPSDGTQRKRQYAGRTAVGFRDFPFHTQKIEVTLHRSFLLSLHTEPSGRGFERNTCGAWLGQDRTQIWSPLPYQFFGKTRPSFALTD